MTLPLTPDSLAAAYEFLRTCPPFKNWKLPHADEVEFRVVRDPTLYGWHKCESGTHCISVSEAGVGHTGTLLRVVGHEMIHVYQAMVRTETPKATHNAEFRRFARQVCGLHGWDAKAFFL